MICGCDVALKLGLRPCATVVILGVRGFFGGRWSVQRSAPSHGDIHHVVSQRRRRAEVIAAAAAAAVAPLARQFGQIIA